MKAGSELETAVPEWLYQERFPAERRSAGRARAFASSRLIEHRLLRLVDPVRLVMDDLAAAAVVHSKAPFQVTLSRTGVTVTLSVEHSSAETVQRSIEALEAGRQRLLAFSRLSLAWGMFMETGGMSYVWASFDIEDGRALAVPGQRSGKG